MDKIVTARTPVISSHANVKHPVLTLAELLTHIDCIQPKAAWKKGKRGHWSLPLYFNDGATGTSRPNLIGVKGKSNFGLSLYEGEDNEKQSKGDDDKKTKKNFVKAWTIALDYQSSPEVQALDTILNASVKGIMIKHLPMLLALMQLPDDTEVETFQRRVARGTSTSAIKSARINCYPGSTQLENEGKLTSMALFPKRTAGDYHLIIDSASIDASQSDGRLSYGPVLYGRVVKLACEEVLQPLSFREDEKAEKDTWNSLPSEEELGKQLKAKRDAKEKEEKAKKQQSKKRKTEEGDKTKKKKKTLD